MTNPSTYKDLPRISAIYDNPVSINSIRDVFGLKFWQFCYYAIGDNRENILGFYLKQMASELENIIVWGENRNEDEAKTELLKKLSEDFENPISKVGQEIYELPLTQVLFQFRKDIHVLEEDFFIEQLPDEYKSLFKEAIPILLRQADKFEDLDLNRNPISLNFWSLVIKLVNLNLFGLNSKKPMIQVQELYALLLYDYIKRCLFLDIKEMKFEPQKAIIKKSKEYTTARQLLAIYYILQVLQIEEEYLNKTDMAKLVHLLAGEDLPANDNLDNSNIYQKVKNIFKANEKYAIQDLDFVLAIFKKLDTMESEGISSIIRLIEKDRDSIKNP